MPIEDLLNSGIPAEEIIQNLKEKTVNVPKWGGPNGLESQYNAEKHPVMNKARYPDIVTDDGVQAVSRVALNFQELATERMTELVTGIPVKRVYKPINDKQKEIVAFLEAIYDKCRVNSLNVERCNMLYAGCEVMTLWYGVEEKNNLYGIDTNLKLRCRNYSPMKGDELYPYFDETGDLVAVSIGYTRRKGKKNIKFFDTYTKDLHVKWSEENGGWKEEEREEIKIGKIPAVYSWRNKPIWKHTSDTVYEMEWALSRNGNYLRENSKPLFVLFTDEVVSYGNEKSSDKEFKSILQLPKGADGKYITWEQASDNLSFYINVLRSLYFAQLQLPDWSYEKMSQQALSGESRKQLFIDSLLKVKNESGPLLEMFDREINVVKAFAKQMLSDSYAKDIDELKVETIITPFSINDEGELIKNLTLANGGNPIMSQRESIELYGHSDDVDKTIQEIQREQAMSVTQPEYAV